MARAENPTPADPILTTCDVVEPIGPDREYELNLDWCKMELIPAIKYLMAADKRTTTQVEIKKWDNDKLQIVKIRAQGSRLYETALQTIRELEAWKCESPLH